MIPKSLQLEFVGYFLKTMDHMAKITTTLSTLSNELNISLEKLNQLLTTLRDEGVLAFARLAVYEEQDTEYVFALKANSHLLQELVELYQNWNKKHCDPFYVELKILDIFTYWQSAMSRPKARLDAKRSKAIKKALLYHSVAEIKKAIDGCFQSLRLGSKHTDEISLIVRNAERLEHFINLNEQYKNFRNKGNSND